TNLRRRPHAAGHISHGDDYTDTLDLPALPAITVSDFVPDSPELAQRIKSWGLALGFQQIGITHIELSTAETRLGAWLDAGFHGELDYMAKHGSKRSRPAELWPGTRRVISARMDYLSADIE